MSKQVYEHHLSFLLQDIVAADLLSSFTKPCIINALTLDSRDVQAGSLFVALSGSCRHGLEFALTAEKQGAAAIIWEADEDYCKPDVAIPCIKIDDLRQHLGIIANRFYAEPSKQLDMIGVTGTDGKTTVTHFIAQAFNTTANVAAVIGTLGIGRPNAVIETGYTTPDVLSVHQALVRLKQQQLAHIAMEVSSHALDQGRVNGVAFDVVVLTNLTRDHLDYHQTVDAYAAAKAKLFAWPTAKTLVLNLDDEFGVRLVNEHQVRVNTGEIKIIGYGVGNAADYPVGSLIASNPRYTMQGIQATIHFHQQVTHLDVPVLGAFNLYNILAAAGSLVGLGMSLKEALTRLGNVDTVAGRMETIVNDQGILVVVDYAHTPGALEQALQAIRKHTTNRLICVFGCGGDRDRGKRPLMARIAEQNADMVILTDDNPRNEMPFQIMNDMIQGLKSPEHVAMEHDRHKAIRFAIQSAAAGDTILIAGKGHETVQIVRGETHQFDDREQAAMALRAQQDNKIQGV
ncbi:MAG TPA: UDP-N-acetylmuramoyl-L-alanyl-D-glutamate--2,6-diaminopimelate ligase [Thiothrix sp.]|nr:UDP-N-acetylmuramoyl-L-alanyl-D-glutamate--2,6-diaminopimelate ligase [Thiothrix sp.]